MTLEHLVTTDAPLASIGAFAKLMFGPVQADAISPTDLAAYCHLVSIGAAQDVEGEFRLLDFQEAITDTWQPLWDKIFVLYPGTKRDIKQGGKRELDILKKKYRWLDRIMPEILEGLETQIQQRKLIQFENTVLAAKGKRERFLPDWPHMQTYLRQGRWTERFDTSEIVAPKEEVLEGDYGLYRQALQSFADQHQIPLVPSMYFTLDEFTNNRARIGIFNGSEFKIADERLRAEITVLHKQYMTNLFLRKDYVSIFEYVRVWWREYKQL